jgi:hypothetical protein
VNRTRGWMRAVVLVGMVALGWSGRTTVTHAGSGWSAMQAGNAPVVTMPCGEMGRESVRNGEPVGEGSDGVWVELASPEAAPLLHIEADAAREFSLMSALATVDVGGGFGAAPAGTPVVGEASTVTLHYCVVGMATRRVLQSTWAERTPAVRPVRDLPSGWAQGMQGMYAGTRRLILFSSSLNTGGQPVTDVRSDEPVVVYVRVEGVK